MVKKRGEPKSGRTFSLLLPKINKITMKLWINEFVKAQKGNDKHIIVMDNASWHKFKKIELPDALTFLDLPPYSPELNPAEKLWLGIRDVLSAKVVENKEHLRSLVVDEIQRWIKYPKEIQSLTLFHWIKDALE